MNILISGGTGLIGSALLNYLPLENHQITILSRSRSGKSDKHPHVRYVSWQGSFSSQLVEQVERNQAVLNLAGENIAGKGFFPQRWNPSKKQRILNSRISIGNALSKAVQSSSRKPDIFIQASAIGYYPANIGDQVLTEKSSPGKDFLSQVAINWEESTKPIDKLGVRRAVIRIGIVLSQQGGALPRLLLPHRLYLGGPLGSGEQWYSWIHIDDICNAIEFLLLNPQASGIYNLTSPNPVRNAEFSRTLGKVLNRPSFFPVPGFVFRLMFGEVASVILDSQKVLPSRLLDANFSFDYPELNSALHDLT